MHIGNTQEERLNSSMKEIEKEEIKEEVKDNSTESVDNEQGQDLDNNEAQGQDNNDQDNNDNNDNNDDSVPSVDNSSSESVGDTLTPSQDDQNLEEGENFDLDQGESREEDVVQEPEEKMLTQSQVNELVGKARQEGRESVLKDLLLRYGVNTEDEMNEIFGRGQSYDILSEDYETQRSSLKDVMAENALLKTHIVPQRYDDVKLILGGKGLDVSEENISSLLESHPEWIQAEVESVENDEPKEFTPEMAENLDKKYSVQPKAQPGTLRKMGSPVNVVPEETDDELAARLFGFKN